MHYIIDGYNLLFRTVHAGKDLQEQRQQIIFEINKKIAFLEIDASIIFDAPHQFGEGSRSHFHHLEIIFTKEGQSADHFILNQLKQSKNPQQETVITSDKALASYARRFAAKTESVEEFLIWLNQRYKNKLRRDKEKASDLKIGLQKIQSKLVEKPAPKPPEPIIVPPVKAPSIEVSAEECSDYYLKVFEAGYEKIKEEKLKKRSKRMINKEVKCKTKPKKLSKEEETKADTERWLHHFEKPPADN